MVINIWFLLLPGEQHHPMGAVHTYAAGFLPDTNGVFLVTITGVEPTTSCKTRYREIFPNNSCSNNSRKTNHFKNNNNPHRWTFNTIRSLRGTAWPTASFSAVAPPGRAWFLWGQSRWPSPSWTACNSPWSTMLKTLVGQAVYHQWLKRLRDVNS